MILIFVHGWSVTHTETYGGLPEALGSAAPPGLQLDIRHVHLGRYISFHDEVTVRDIARAFDAALHDALPGGRGSPLQFSCVTHSTGAPMVRTWLDQYYGTENLDKAPLRHLVMLAPANHGSALAQLGKSRLSRIRAWFQGAEPGRGVLNWLELGSREQLELNLRWLSCDPAAKGVYLFVLAGQTIDPSLYDHLNSYTAEAGSDGVVRLAAANLNYRHVRLEQTPNLLSGGPGATYELAPAIGPKPSPRAGFGVIPSASHSGEKIGIMRSVTDANAPRKPVVAEILRCLGVNDRDVYAKACDALSELTKRTQLEEKKIPRCSMVVWRIMDDAGAPIPDFDLRLLGGAKYDPDRLPKGFFVDRQRNGLSPNVLTYYLNHDKMSAVASGKIGFRIDPRPDSGFAFYSPGEFRSGGMPLDSLLRPNETLIVDIVLKRRVDRETFRLDPADQGRRGFEDAAPTGELP